MTKFMNILRPSLYSFFSILACFILIMAVKNAIPDNLTATLLYFLASTIVIMILEGYISIVTKEKK